METSIETRDLTRRFGDFVAVDRLTLRVERGEVFGFLGANGAGKTTAIRMLCGLLQPSSGSGKVAGCDIQTETDRIRSRIGYMPQKFALYPDFSVEMNLQLYGGLYGLQGDVLRTRMETVGKLLSLEPLLSRRTDSIPWGWQQRLNLACAILHQPEIVFLDEPTAGLDPDRSESFVKLIQSLQQKLGFTVIMITHDLGVVAEMADRVVVMNAGLIEQVGSPNELYHSPATKFVAGFIGSPAMNFIPCHLEQAAGALRVRLSDTLSFPVPADRTARYNACVGKPNLVLGLRPEHIIETRPHIEPNQHDFEQKIDVVEPMGMETLVYFNIAGAEVCGRVSPNAPSAAGKSMKLRADLSNMHLIDDSTGKVL